MATMLHRPGLILFLFCISFYTMIQYGGIRAPDAEVVFRVAENLSNGKGFGVSADLENWKGFGVAYGKDSVLYSVYPPGESVALVPFILTARWINQSAWYENVNVPLSHYVNDGLRKTLYGQIESNKAPHALRFLCSFFNVLCGSIGVLLFYIILLRMTRSEFASFAVSVLYAFGTILWSYAGTFFSEPLTLVWILASFYFLIKSDRRFLEKPITVNSTYFLLAGTMLGLALVTHTNSVMLLPFFFWYCVQLSGKNWSGVLLFAAGIIIFAFLLGGYNWMRFDSMMETGRGLSQHNPVDFASPLSGLYWKNLFALLFGYGKGLLWFCPAVLLGIATWGTLQKNHRTLSIFLSTMILGVILMVPAYAYWHAGFCLGPRYLMMIIPFLLIPLAFWIKETMERDRIGLKLIAVACAASLAVIQQLYFCIGELFSYYHIMKWSYLNKGVDIFINDRIYIDWLFSPIHQLLEFFRGPFLFRSLSVSNQILWTGLSFLILLILAAAIAYLFPKTTNKKTSRLQ